MNSLFFWSDWNKTYKYLYIFLLTIFFSCTVVYLLTYFIGFKAVIDWGIESQFDNTKITIDEFTRNLFNYSIDTNNYLIKERFYASDIKVTPVFSYIYFAIVVLATLVVVSILTRLELAWYAIGMGVFIFFLVYLHTELLGILGSSSRKFIFIAIALYVGLSFYYQAYNETLSFAQRLLSFIALTVILGLVVAFGSQTPEPFLYIANYGMVIPIVLSVIFIIAISFDIINGFLFITTSTKNGGKNTILHFSVVTLLYLINLLLIFFKKKGIITGDFIYINVFFIYLASSILGIWGVRKRGPLFNNIINVRDASFIYISFAIISTSTIAYAFITGNDPLKDAFEYFILYSHLGIGLVFFLYILYNFWELFYKNISAYQLVYQPRRMPFFMVRPLGLLITVSLFMQANTFAYKLARSGYYNCIGDVYFHQKKYSEAKEVYDEAVSYGNRSMRPNYSMASVLEKVNNKQEAAQYYANSLQRHPTEYAFINLGNLYSEGEMFFPALFNLKDGIKLFPHSGELYNNLAFLYSSKGIWDTTAIQLTQSKKYLKENEVSSANFLWFLAKNNLNKEADSILKIKDFENDILFQNNKLVILTLNGETNTGDLNEDFMKDSIINWDTYSYLFNYVTNKLKIPEEAVLKKIDYYLKYSGNANFHNDLSFLKCLKLYYSGQKAQSILQLKNLSMTASTSSSLYYNKILGLWAIQQEAYKVASENLKVAISFEDNETQLNYAIALLEAGEIKEGTDYLNQLKNTPDKETKLVCENLLMVLNTNNIEEIKNWEDAFKFHFLHFRKNTLPEKTIMQVYYLFKEENFRLIATAEIMKYFISIGKADRAENIWNDFPAKIKQNENTYAWSLVNYQYLKLLENQKNWKTLKNAAANTSLDKHYFYAISDEGLGNFNEAEKHYNIALKESPYNEFAITRAAAFYNERNNSTKGYDILLQSIELNPFSVSLQKAYALQALKMNLTSYAEDTLEKIKSLVNAKEYLEFKKIFDSEKALAEKQFQEY